MVIIQNLDQQKPKQDKSLHWSDEKERQLKRLLLDQLECKKLASFLSALVKECFEVGITAKSLDTLAALTGRSKSSVRRYIAELEQRKIIRCARTMSRYTHKNSVNIIVINWTKINYHPPRQYSIDCLKQLKHINLISPHDRFWINGLFQAHNKDVNNYHEKKSRKLHNEHTGSNIISTRENLPNYPQKQIKKIDDQQSTAFAAGYLSNLVDNLAMSFLSNIDEHGFNRVRYQSDHLNRDIMHKAFCRELWKLHRNHGTDALINGCFYALANISLFPKVSTAKRLAANFGLILRMQKQGIKLIAENTYPCRIERYEQCFEGDKHDRHFSGY